MYADIKTFIRKCETCNAFKYSVKKNALLKPIEVVDVWHTVGVDIVGPLPETLLGNKYIVVFVDYLSKWPEAFALKNATTYEIANVFVTEILTRHGSPAILLSDRGTNFLSEMMSNVLAFLKIDKKTTTSYHPQCNGLTESTNKDIVLHLKMFAAGNKNNWDTFLQFALLAKRAAIQSSTGLSPFNVLYGRDCNFITDPNPNRPIRFIGNEENIQRKLLKGLVVTQEVSKYNIEKAQQKQAESYNKNIKPVEFKEGDLVYLENKKTSKFSPSWIGPYKIIQKINSNVYKLLIPNRRIHPVVSANRIRLAYVTEEELKNFQMEDKMEEELEVVKILAKKVRNGDVFYKVLWKDNQKSWEPISNLINAADSIALFERNIKK